ncbi:MAG: hypothetical protein LBR26_17590 [Prevotella sp.]|jgi:hypothetical protein|nr:hypothetical protein [Prevotella sp.]
MTEISTNINSIPNTFISHLENRIDKFYPGKRNEIRFIFLTGSNKSSSKEHERNIDTKKDNNTSIENEVNNKRISILEQDFTHRLILNILEEDFEYGMASKAHILVKEQMKINAIATKDWLNRIYVNNFQNIKILIGILQVIS